MNLGILGSGMIVMEFLKIVEELNLESISIFSRKFTKEKKDLLKSYPIKKYYESYDELLNSDIDTVYIALPNHLHFQFAKEALLQNKHVIIEKPITSNYKELEELVDIAKKKKKIILEAVNLHYLPAFIALKQSIENIGNLKIVNFNYSQYSSRYDAFKRNEIHPVFDPEKSGGALMDLNIYNINAMIGLFGSPKNIQYLANIDRNIDTSGIVLYEYPNFKGISIGAKDCKAFSISTIQGDKGCITIKQPLNQMTSYEIEYNDGNCERFHTEDVKHRLYYEFLEFKKIIDGNKYDRSVDMLSISLEVARLMEKARKEEGIFFPSDNEK